MTVDYRAKRESCREMYMAGRTNTRELAAVFSVTSKTIRKWIKDGGWEGQLSELETLDEQIRLSIRRALLIALRQYAESPQDTALQSLVSLLKQYQKVHEPEKDLIENMKRFLDWQVDFYHAKGDEETAKAIQREILGESGQVAYFIRRASHV
ncbi:MAG: hypothetical protein K8R90_02090 [Candidatus Cloacimonetes bacterium]|nr:hypothetical protein [Candidatus Cloacimonadota bacterium]